MVLSTTLSGLGDFSKIWLETEGSAKLPITRPGQCGGAARVECASMGAGTEAGRVLTTDGGALRLRLRALAVVVGAIRFAARHLVFAE